MDIEGYDRITPIAQGGSATVYRARQIAFERDVAVKVLAVPLGDGRDRRRFERECVLTGRLTGHPHIVTILDSGFTPHGQPYLTTPFYESGSLDARLSHDGPFSVRDTLAIGVGVAGALEIAHRAGILHRDVKPGNVLLSNYGEPALTDFGIAAIVQPSGIIGTQITQAFTIDHAPPELLEGGRATVAADIYSLGSTLWTLLTGRAAFDDGDPGLIPRMLKAKTEPVPPIGRHDVPAALEAVLATAMAKQPEDRQPTAAAFGEALQQIQREMGDPVTALHVGPPARSVAAPAAERVMADAVAGGSAAAPPRWRSGETIDGGEPPTRWTPAPSGRAFDRYGAADDGLVLSAPAGDAVDPGEPTAALPTALLPATAPPPGPTVDAEPEPDAAATPWSATPARTRPALPASAVAALVVLVGLALLGAGLWFASRDGAGDSLVSTPAPVESVPTTAAPVTPTTVAPAPAPTAAPTTPAPPTTATPPTTTATLPPTTAPAPTTAAPGAGPGRAVVPADAPAAVRSSADVGQQAGSALAGGDWDAARSLIPSLAGTSDASLEAGWGRLDGVTMVVTDWQERNGQVVMRLGQVAHERNQDDSRRTNLYCATYTVSGGKVVAMANQQYVGANPWRAGAWVDPGEAVDLLRSQCTKL